MPKTNAERVREHRARKRAAEKKTKKTAKTSTERVRKFRARQKAMQVTSAADYTEPAECYVSYVQDVGNNSSGQETDVKPDLPYTQCHRNKVANKDFQKQLYNNSSGRNCCVCDRLLFKNDLKEPAAVHEQILNPMIAVNEYNKIPTIEIKIEYDPGGASAAHEPLAGFSCGRGNPLEDVGMFVKKEDFVRKTEDEAKEMTIKQELDIGPTVLQPKTIISSLLSPTHTSSELCPGTSFEGGEAPAPLYTVRAPSATSIKTESNYFEEYSGNSSGSSFPFDGSRKNDVYQKLPRERLEGEDTSVVTHRGSRDRGCVTSHTERDCGSDASVAKTDAQNRTRYECCKYDTTTRSKIKHKSTTHLQGKKKQCKCGTCQVCLLKTNVDTRTSPILYKCEDCKSDENKLKKNSDIHTRDTPLNYEKSISLVVGLKTHPHTRTNEKHYKCEQCDYASFRVDNLKTHMRTHTGERPYKCELCEYSATQIGILKKHVRTHTGEKPYKCHHCEYSASQPGNLKIHLRTHTGEKPYKCKYCEYRTGDVRNLNRHMRTHTGERPYKCEQCEYSASQLSSLNTHMRTHTGEKPYKCEQCEYSASQLGSLNMHMRTHTGQKCTNVPNEVLLLD